MSERAHLTRTEKGFNPSTPGWYVLHTSEAPWVESRRFGRVCDFEGDARFPHLGINIHVVQPNQPACLYHRENAQEDFFVLSGECLLLIEDEEIKLRAGHFVHCPPATTHVFVGSGSGPCAILMIGHRPSEHELCYPASELASRYGASAAKETADPREAYGGLPVFGETADPVWPLY